MMYNLKKNSLFTIASITLSSISISHCSQPRKKISIDPKNIQHHIDLEKVQLDPVEVLKTSMDGFKKIITYERDSKNIKSLGQTGLS